jgi:putative ABC transport system permease protein
MPPNDYSAPSLKLYRALLRLYPATFRDNYAHLLERQFQDELNEAAHPAALALLWLRLLLDLALSLPRQLASELSQDTRHTLRLWARHPGPTAFAILALAIGIGANTGVFSVVNALLLRSLPFHDPARLAYLSNFNPPHDSTAQFHNWRRQSSYLADTALFEPIDANLVANGASSRADVIQASSNFFSVLGVQPILGRAFSPGDDVDAPGYGTPGPNAVAVISYRLWQSLYNADPNALGKTLEIDGIPLTIIGVAPPTFDYPGQTTLWKPAAFSPGNNGWEVVARLQPTLTWSQARQAFAAEADRLWPNRTPLQQIQNPSKLTPLQDHLAGPTKQASIALLACVALILLLACTNVANLLLARTADRAAELSIRSSLGASQARLFQQLLTECILLALAASLAGIVVAYATTAAASRVQPAPIASQAYSLLDTRVLAFAITIALLSGLLFGLLPAIYAGRLHTFGARGTTTTRSSYLIRESLVAAQVVLTIILLASSLSLDRAFLRLLETNRGFTPANLATINVALSGTTHEGKDRALAYFHEALTRIRRLPGVRAASATEFLPLYATGFIGGVFAVDGQPDKAQATVIPIFSDYFRTMGGQILAGREFTQAELQSNAPVVIVNDRFAAQFGSPAAALGHQVFKNNRKIIGVVKAMDYRDRKNDPQAANPSQVFVPSTKPGGFFSTFVVRVDGPAEASLAMLRDTLQSMDRQVPIFGAKTMQDRLTGELARPHFYRTAVLCFAGIAFLLAALGIYAVVAYTVARRTHDLGVRLALGTTPSELRQTLIRQGLQTIALAAIPGAAGALLAGRYLQSLVEGAQPATPAAQAAALLFIAATAATAIWAATRPISRLDIADVLRAD